MNPACIVRMTDKGVVYQTATPSNIVPTPSIAGDGVYTADGSPPIGTFKWNKTNLTYSITLVEKVNNIDMEDVITSINSTFSKYHLLSGFTFTLVPDSPIVDIRIGFSNTDPLFIQSPDIMARTYYPRTNNTTDFTSLYNTNYLWTEDGLYNFSNNINETLFHEIGHSLGLVHTSDPKDIMFPFYHDTIIPSSEDLLQIHACCGTSKYPNWIIQAYFKADQALDFFRQP